MLTKPKIHKRSDKKKKKGKWVAVYDRVQSPSSIVVVSIRPLKPGNHEQVCGVSSATGSLRALRKGSKQELWPGLSFAKPETLALLVCLFSSD